MAPGAGQASAGRLGSAPSAERWQRVAAVVLLLLTWAAFVFPAFGGEVRFPVDFGGPAAGESDRDHVLENHELGDAYYAFYPWRTRLAASLDEGRFPLWDPYRFAGTPFAADITIGTWYPPNWLYAFGDILTVFTAIAVGSLLVALLLAYWFFRVVRLHPVAAAAGAIVFVFSAFVVKWSTNEAVLASSMWLPLALGGLAVARRGRRRRGIALAAAGLALSVLGGHAQVALLVWLASAIWVAVDAVADARAVPPGAPGGRRRELVRGVAPGAVAFVVAAGLAAVQIVPSAAFADDIVRQRTDLAMALSTALPWNHLPTLLIPDYLGNPLHGNYVGPGVNYTETALYAGVLALVLAVVALVRTRGRLTVFFAVVTVMAALAVAGTPLYRLVLALPGFSRTVWVTRFTLLLDFGLAGLAALGLHALLTQPGRWPVPVVLTTAGAGLFGVALLTVGRPGTDAAAGYVARHGLRAVAVLLLGAVVLGALLVFRRHAALWALALAAVMAVDLWFFGFRFNPYFEPRPVYRRSPAVEAVAAAPGQRPRHANLVSWWIPPNGGLPYRLHDVSGYDPFVPRRIVELVGVAEDQMTNARTMNSLGPFRLATASSPVLDLLGVRSVLGHPDERLPLPLRFAGTFRVYDRPTALPPAWITSCWERVADRAGLRRMATMSSQDFAHLALVAADAADGLPRDRPGPGCGPAGRARVERYEAERVVLRADADTEGVLVLSDAWFPGWQATVDGRRTAVLRVDHALRGVPVGPGPHTIEFRFRPAEPVVGGAISLATAAGLAGWAALPTALASRRRRRPVPGPASSPGRPRRPSPAG